MLQYLIRKYFPDPDLPNLRSNVGDWLIKPNTSTIYYYKEIIDSRWQRSNVISIRRDGDWGLVYVLLETGFEHKPSCDLDDLTISCDKAVKLYLC